jgi:hypothetical protein
MRRDIQDSLIEQLLIAKQRGIFPRIALKAAIAGYFSYGYTVSALEGWVRRVYGLDKEYFDTSTAITRFNRVIADNCDEDKNNAK